MENVEKLKKLMDSFFFVTFWLDLGRFPYLEVYLDPEHSSFNGIATLNTINVVISSDYPSLLHRYWSKYMTISKKCPIFSVFCMFLNKEWAMWHYLYIFVKLIQGATTFVKRVKQVAVFLGPWECWPKKEICGSFIEHAVMFLNMVTKCD